MKAKNLAPQFRILYLQPSTCFGGAERQAVLSAAGLREWGFDVVPMVGPGRTVVEWLAQHGVHDVVFTRSFPGDWPKPRGLRRAVLPGRYLRCVRRLRDEIRAVARAQRIDLVFAAMGFSWVAATPVARELGLPIVWRAGGTEGGLLLRAALRAFAGLNPPDLLVSCGNAVRDKFAPLIPAPSVVIPNGVDTERFAPGRGDPTRLRPAGARMVVGFSGRLVAQKRPEDVIRIAAALVPRHPGLVFLFAGSGSHLAACEQLARDLGVAHAVRFLGYVADMPSFYAACDIVVLPSRSEGSPNTVLESLAMGRALAVSNAAGTLPVVRDGEDAIVFPVGDIGAFARAVEHLILEPGLRDAMAERRRNRVAREFSSRRNVARLAEVLRAQVTGATRERPPETPERQAQREVVGL